MTQHIPVIAKPSRFGMVEARGDVLDKYAANVQRALRERNLSRDELNQLSLNTSNPFERTEGHQHLWNLSVEKLISLGCRGHDLFNLSTAELLEMVRGWDEQVCT